MKKQPLWACIAFLFCVRVGAQTVNLNQKLVANPLLSVTIPDRVAFDYFGQSVAIDGNYMVVGANLQDLDSAQGGYGKNQAGAVYVYELISGSWSFVKKITPRENLDSSRVANDQFGYSVAISGDIIVVGAYLQDYDSAGGNSAGDAGAAYIFNRNSGGTNNWGLLKKLVGKGTNGRLASDQFGHSVSVSGDIVAVGTWIQNYDSAGGNGLSNCGAVYLFNRHSGGTDNWGFMKKITGTGTNGRLANDQFGWSVSISGSIVVVGAPNQDYDSAGSNSTNNAGAAYIFNRHSGGTDNWGLMKKITGTGTNGRVATDQFGSSVSISGDVIAVGAYGQDYDSAGGNNIVDAGAAYLFNRNSGGTDNWGMMKKVTGKGTNGRVTNDYFGYSVSISGDIALIGAFLQDTDSAGANSGSDPGAAFIFNRQSGGTDNWGFMKKIAGTGTNGRGTTDNFGRTVGVSGDIVVVGARQHDYDNTGANSIGDVGAAFIYNRHSGGTNNFGVMNKISGRILPYLIRSASDEFGYSVSVSDNIMVVGAYNQDYDSTGLNIVSNAGAAYIYYRNTSTGNWYFVKKITGKGTNGRLSNDYFGFSLAVSSDVIVVGAYENDYDAAGGSNTASAGAAYVFHKDQGGTDNWGFVKKLTGEFAGTLGREASDEFARRVSVSGDVIVIGVHQQDYDAAGSNSLSQSGAAYVFHRNSGGTNNWGFVKRLTGEFAGTNGRNASDLFGRAVSVSGDIMVIGSEQSYDSAGGNSVSQAGAAYIFYRNQGGTDNWGFIKKLTGQWADTNGRVASDLLGYSVSVSGDVLVAGAPQQDYDSAGASSQADAGAAYVFHKDQGGADNWGFVKKLTGEFAGTNGRVAGDQFGIYASVADDFMVVGAQYQDYDSAGGNNSGSTGAAYVFYRNEGGTNNWGFLKKITGKGTNGRIGGDEFGPVSTSGEVIVAGARFQDYDSDGGRLTSNAGAAYVFNLAAPSLTYTGGAWSPSAPSSGTGSYKAYVLDGTATVSAGSAVSEFSVSGGATATLSGDLSMTGAYTNNGTVSGAGTIVLNGTSAQTISGTGTTTNLTLNNSTGATISSGTQSIAGILTLTSGQLTTGGNLTLAATGATTYGQIAGTGTGTISGNVTAQYLITGGGAGYRAISAPVNGATLAQLSDDYALDFANYTTGNTFYFDESTTPFWTIASGTSASMDSRVYSVYMGGSATWANPLPITMDIAGTYNGTSDYTVNSLTRTNAVTNQSGWHYVRNPWPSGFNWNGTGGGTNVTINAGGVQGSQVWVYNQNGGAGSYTAFDAGTPGVVPPFHAFTVEVTANNSSLTFLNAGRNTATLVNYFDKTSLPNFIELEATDKKGNTDKAKFYTDANATNGYDIMDGNKMMNTGIQNLYFVQQGKNANKLVYNTLPAQNEYLALNFEAKVTGKYTLNFTTENLEPNTIVTLEDKLSGAKHDVSKGSYEFNHDITNAKERFELHFAKIANTGVEEATENAVYVGSTGSDVTISIANKGTYTIEVLDLLGRTIQAPTVFENTGNQTQTITVNGINPGYYLVNIKGDDVFKTTKVFLK